MKQKSGVKSKKSSSIRIGHKVLKAHDLRWTCPTDKFKFKTTAELKQLDSIIGQPRAVEALRLGSEIRSKGYNVFVSGLSGTGRLTTVKMILEQFPMTNPEVYDFCYVNNFVTPDTPRLIRLKKGEGKQFANTVDDAIAMLRKEIPRFFEGEDYKISSKKIIEHFQKLDYGLIKEFDKKINANGFIRGTIDGEQGTQQLEVFPVIDGKAAGLEAVNEAVANGTLTSRQADAIMKKFKIYHSELIDINTKHIKLMLELKKALEKNDSDSIGAVVETVLDMVADNFEYPSIKVFVNEMKQFIVANIGLFVQFMNTMEPIQTNEQPIAGEERFDIFKVNVIVDNSNTVKPPIIIETTPSFTNLFGAIERTIDKNGFWRTDFTKIRAGAILRADGGFLVVNANDLFEEQGVWQALKRVLLYNKLEIQTFESLIQFSQVYIKPEPINVNLKVIIIGGLTLYKMLYEYEKGFKKIFKINAQFDYESNLNDSIIKNYARFAAKISNEENLAHCTPSGVAAVIEWAVEQAGSKDKITLKFSDVADVIREAAFYDRYSVKKHIDRNDVEKAIEMHRFRNDLFDQKMKDVILDGIVLIDVKGQRVGQVNGLTVIDDGLISFGKPARITATASVGRAGIINIEREADLSGSIHNKGMLIITSFLRERFADKYPLTLTASIAFEQNYGGIDGDSASAAEIYVLISAITGLPLNQNMALTGSMNQKGDIQPIGGVNQKVTGFFEICKAVGFTGNQGVLVPEQNVKDLMLRKEITDDVRNGNFHVYSYSSIDDGFELMFGIPCGRKDKSGNYPEGTVYRILTEKLKLLWEASKSEKQDK